MNNCELCKGAATTFCESDQASLCWDCDAKVHGANFLVARHQRTLLCQACKSLTPWKASGATLGNTVSLCQRCVGGTRVNIDEGEESQGDNDDEIESLFDEDEEDEDDDDDGDNQVVPMSSTASAPPACSSSCDGESVTRGSHGDEDVSESTAKVSLKRRREDNDLQEGSKRRYLYGGNRRERADLLTSDDEPPLNMSSPTAMGRINGSRGCCDIKESEDN